MLKKLICFLTALFLLTAPVSHLYAEESAQQVIDNASLFSSSEKAILTQRCEWLLDNNLIFIILTDNTDADILSDKINGFSESGLIYYINANAGTTHLFASGDTSIIFDDEIINSITSIANECYGNIGPYEACQSVIYNIENRLNGSVEFEPTVTYMPPVIDETNTLTAEEIDTLSSHLESIRLKYLVDVAVVFQPECTSDAETMAENIYDYLFYGIGESDHGILLYVSLSPRNYHFTTHPYPNSYFSDSNLIYLENLVLPYLRQDDYYGAFTAFALGAEEILSSDPNTPVYPDTSEDYNNSYTPIPHDYANDDYTPIIAVVIVIGIPLLSAVLFTSIRMAKMNTAKEQNYANSYRRPGSFNLAVSRDIFLYSRTSRRPKPKPTDNNHTPRSGGFSSGSFGGSSGRSHGGRGGRF